METNRPETRIAGLERSNRALITVLGSLLAEDAAVLCLEGRRSPTLSGEEGEVLERRAGH